MSTKTSLLQELKFKGIWRSYQQRVLNELDYHLDDSKLNIVAAPGAKFEYSLCNFDGLSLCYS